MRFHHKKYPNCLVVTKDKKEIIFESGYAETTDKTIQKALEANKDIEKVEEKKDDK